MKRGVMILLAAVVLLSAGYIILRPVQAGETVRVYQAGEVIWEGVLEEPDVFHAPHNTVVVEGGRVRVSQADCPDQVCVNQGWISDGTVPIVCLPNQLIVQIEGGGNQLDAQTG